MADVIAWPDDFIVPYRPVVVYGQSVDERSRTPREGRGLSRSGAHVAFLAGDSLLVGGGCAVLLPDGLELDAGMDLHLVAGHAELRLLDDGGLNGLLMDS